MQYEKMVIIFIDIIGSKEITDFEKKYEIHKLFHSSVRESQRRQQSDSHSHVAYDRKLFSFSDCAYITYFYKPDIEPERRNTEHLMQVALFNTSILALRLASRGYRVRGGVTFGEAFVDSDGCFGPAVNEAYRLESKVAKFPRILLSSDIGDLQYDFETKMQSLENVAIANRMMRDWVPRIVHRDDDENFYLNILYMLEMDSTFNYDGDQLTLEGIREVLVKNIDAELIKHKENEYITAQIEWFSNYLSKSKCSLKGGQVSYGTMVSVS
ncbi:adenylate/guanylate cyclase domain-containing protein [Paraburkholderia sp. Cy-641]|uniref:adenylate/guanylate cyclase domain-containing protein n=1 Tax=Paraburkholderia sp. Cy-641 TaxID=2608337 RepID=UPI0014219FD4|nr:adenylate/guanylate cyclase domain-containing protein [Paraburkholderia sp. Cy-641]NIF78084.1 adenylate/guanylate cyclase domain-containing protein [Paraburkholderia sp. Cy-641]